jgi:hypothetical protein
MTSKFIIPHEFQFSTNESIRCIQEDEGEDFSCQSPDIIMPLQDFIELDRRELKNYFESNSHNEHSIFNQHRILQLAELDRVKEQWFNFLISPKGATARPIDVLDENLYYKVRLMKLREVLNPQFACVNVVHPKTKYKYVVAKAYDWNDLGERARSFNKSIIRNEGSIIAKLFEIYEDMGYEVRTNVTVTMDKGKPRKIADMVISKDKKEFAVEVKMSGDHLARFILAESMWESYKSKYQLNS